MPYCMNHPVGVTGVISEAFLVRLAGKPYWEELTLALGSSPGPRKLLQSCPRSGNLLLNDGTVAVGQDMASKPAWVGKAPCTGVEGGWDGGHVQ